ADAARGGVAAVGVGGAAAEDAGARALAGVAVGIGGAARRLRAQIAVLDGAELAGAGDEVAGRRRAGAQRAIEERALAALAGVAGDGVVGLAGGHAGVGAEVRAALVAVGDGGGVAADAALRHAVRVGRILAVAVGD